MPIFRSVDITCNYSDTILVFLINSHLRDYNRNIILLQAVAGDTFLRQICQ